MWRPSRAREAVEIAARARGIDYSELQLLQFSKSAVYRLHPYKIVARVSRPKINPQRIQTGADVSAWLWENDFQTIRPMQELGMQPLLVKDNLVFFWEYKPWLTNDVGPGELGKVLRSFHETIKQYPEPLLDWEVIEDIEIWIEERKGALRSFYEPLARELNSLKGVPFHEAMQGNIHGNFHQENALRSADGILLTDFDLVSRGPLEWDLAHQALRAKHYRNSEEYFKRFCFSYGFDPSESPLFEQMVRLRELLATTFRAYIDPQGFLNSSEFKNRMAYWQGKHRPPYWEGF